jgi:hypothetical protein
MDTVARCHKVRYNWRILCARVAPALRIVTTSNCSANANSRTLQFTIAVQSLLGLLYLRRLSPGNGFQSRSFLSFRVHVLTGRRLYHNWLNSRLVLLITPRHGPRKEHHFPVSTLVLVRNVSPPLSNNGRCLQSNYLMTGVHAALF